MSEATLMGMVLDASATLAWIYPDESTDAVRQVFDQLQDGEAWVPTHWWLEVANVLEMHVRRGRRDSAFRDAMLADLARLPIRTDLDTNIHAWKTTLRLAERHRITLYDAAYLELAKRRGLPLATLDRELRASASTEGVLLLAL